jgi:trimeric autotransporter adhesin
VSGQYTIQFSSSAVGTNRTLEATSLPFLHLQDISPLTIVCPPISISVTPSLTVASGTSVTLTASSGVATAGTSYTWSDGSTANPLVVSNITSTTAFSVTGVTSGCVASTTATVVVPSLTLVSSASPTSVCVGSLASLSVAASGGTGPYSYTWSAPSGAAISGASNTSVVSVSGSTSGLKTFTITVADASGTPIRSFTTVDLTVNPSVTASVAGNLTLCAGSATTLTASGGTTYNWIGGVNGATLPVSVAGTFSVTGMSLGCSGTATATVTVNPAVTASIAASPSLTICPGSVATLTASGAGVGGTYRWSNAQQTAAISVSVSGPYTVTATSAGCSGTATVTVSVTSPAPLSDPTLSASSSVVCEGGAVSVTATANGSVSYQWYQNGASLGAAQRASVLSLNGVQSSQAGNYVLVIQASGCSSATSTAFALTVNPLPTVTISFPAIASVNPAGPTVTVPVGTGLFYQVFGGTSYNRLIDIDRVNGYLLRQTNQNTTGIFPIDRAGPYSITVTGANGCSRTVTGVIVGR